MIFAAIGICKNEKKRKRGKKRSTNKATDEKRKTNATFLFACQRHFVFFRTGTLVCCKWELCKITSCSVTSEAGELQGSCLTRRTAIDVQTMIGRTLCSSWLTNISWIFLFKDDSVVEHCLRSCPRQVQEVELETFTSRSWSKGEWTDGRDTCVCSGRVLFSAGSKRPLSQDCDHELRQGDLAKPHH